jgi:hypothetical protein
LRKATESLNFYAHTERSTRGSIPRLPLNMFQNAFWVPDKVYYNIDEEPVADGELYATICDHVIMEKLKSWNLKIGEMPPPDKIPEDIDFSEIASYYELSYADKVRAIVERNPPDTTFMYLYGEHAIYRGVFDRLDYANIIFHPGLKLVIYKFGLHMSCQEIIEKANTQPFKYFSAVFRGGKSTPWSKALESEIIRVGKLLTYNYDVAVAADGTRDKFSLIYLYLTLGSPNFSDADFEQIRLFLDYKILTRHVRDTLTSAQYPVPTSIQTRQVMYRKLFPPSPKDLQTVSGIKLCALETEYAIFHNDQLSFTQQRIDRENTQLVFTSDSKIKFGSTLAIDMSNWSLVHVYVDLGPTSRPRGTIREYPLSPEYDRRKFQEQRKFMLAPFGTILTVESKEFKILEDLVAHNSALDLMPIIEACVQEAAKDWEFEVPVIKTPDESPSHKVSVETRLSEPGERLPYTQTKVKKDAKLRKRAEDIASSMSTAKLLRDSRPVRDVSVARPAPAHLDPEVIEDSGSQESLVDLRDEMYRIARGSGKFTSQLNSLVKKLGLLNTVRYVLIKGSHLVFHTDGRPITVVIPHK